MSLFGNLTQEGLERPADFIGGGRKLVDSGAYEMNVKLAYAGKSESGAMSITVIGTLNDDAKTEYRETFWITSSKTGANYYMTKDGKKAQMGGFADINDLCLIATGKELSQQTEEEKLVKVWNSAAKAEQPEARVHLPELEGKAVGVVIQRQMVNKQSKGADGKYHDTAESQEENVIKKFFDVGSRYTVNEAVRLKKGEAVNTKFVDEWLKVNAGNVYDARKIKDGQAAGGATAGAPPVPGNAAPAATGGGSGLFG